MAEIGKMNSKIIVINIVVKLQCLLHRLSVEQVQDNNKLLIIIRLNTKSIRLFDSTWMK